MMEVGETQSVLQSVLAAEELVAIPEVSLKKIEALYEQRFEEFLTAKALCETKKSELESQKESYENQIEQLSLKVKDESAKFHFTQQSVKELQIELEDVKQELVRTKEKLAQYEQESGRYRQERNEAVDERDTLLSAVERKTLEVERLQADVVSLEHKLKSANDAKCTALAKLDELDGKEYALEFKEKRMERELALRDSQIAKLTEDLERSMHELQAVRRDKNVRSLTVEAKLSEKIEELKIANQTIAHLSERDAVLSKKVEELTMKLLAQQEDTSKMMEQYQKQLMSESNLNNLLQQDKSDHMRQTEELERAASELRSLLNEATEQYGKLETEKKRLEAKHEEDLAAKDRVIQEQQDELKHANQLLEEARVESLEHAVEKLAPSAAATSRMLKSGMSLTQVYSKFVQASEELIETRKDNDKLRLQMSNILAEVECSAPKITHVERLCRNLKDQNEELNSQLAVLINENGELKSELKQIWEKLRNASAENDKLQKTRSDLSRQVCSLLEETTRLSTGARSQTDESLTSNLLNEGLSRKRITYRNIEELQANNADLIMTLHELNARLKVAEGRKDTSELEAQLHAREEMLREQQQKIQELEKILHICKIQRDRYLARSRYSAPTGGMHVNGEMDDSQDVGERGSVSREAYEAKVAEAAASSVTLAEKERRIADLEAKLKERQQELATMKEEYETYRREKLQNDKLMNDQFDRLRTENRELSTQNVKLLGGVEYQTDQNRIMKMSNETLKKQISTLEERAKNYEITIAKHETTIVFLKDQAIGAQSMLSRAEVQLGNLKHELRILKDSESRLQAEREMIHRERQQRELILNDVEMIKVSMERSESEGRLRLEKRLDETSRECSALRRRLQEEQDRFRELTSQLQRQNETAHKRMEEEIAIAETVAAELKNAKEELEIKQRKIDDLQRKLQATLSPSDEDNPVTQANRKVRELEHLAEQNRIEIDSLKEELSAAKEHARQYAELAESSEKELKELSGNYTKEREASEQELAMLRKQDAELRAQISELNTELSLKITGAQLSASSDGGDRESELHKVQLEKKQALEQLAQQNRELREMRDKQNALAEQLQQAEQKYANEMVLHSSDIQQLAQLKEELLRTNGQFVELREARDLAAEQLRTNEECWTRREELLRAEINQMEERLSDLNAQNTTLHDQLQTISTRLLISSTGAGLNETLSSSAVAVGASGSGDAGASASGTDGEATPADESMSVTGIADSSLLNRSLRDDEKASVEQLLQIIKYLRKEKDIAMARYDLANTAKLRLQSEQQLVQKRLEEVQSELKAVREQTDAGIVSAAKHEEILRRLETFNAITDSNRVLREERDTLAKQVADFSQRLRSAEEELLPLQEKVRELTVKMESTVNEATVLRQEAVRWRSRATMLIDRSNKTSTDDWKRLQTERENLAKMLTTEQELLKRANDELNTLRLDRTRLETELASVGRKLTSCGEETRNLLSERDTLQQSLATLQQNVAALQKNLATLTTENATLKLELNTRDTEAQSKLDEMQTSLANKELALTDAKNKEQQIRKIAKRYKESFIEMQKENDELKVQLNINPAAEAQDKTEPSGGDSTVESGGGGGSGTSGEAANFAAQLEDLRSQTSEEIDMLRKENELLRAKMEKVDQQQRTQGGDTAAAGSDKHRIAALTEQKANMVRELQTVRAQLLKAREELDLQRTQYEARLAQLEKEASESKEVIGRLSRENEQLTVRLSQLTRQLGLQQATKPSTSAGVVGAGSSEKPVGESPRTANVKPMAGPSVQQSATVTPRRVNETPLASIRPMAVGSRTVAVLPTSQTSCSGSSGSSSSSSTSTGGNNVAIVQGSSSSGMAATGPSSNAVPAGSSSSVTGAGPGSSSSSITVGGSLSGTSSAVASSLTTALVPPQQQVHTTASSSSSSSAGVGGNLNESLIVSSSPSSSHTDYMPATSSANVAVAAVPPMGSATTSSSSSASLNAAESSSSSSTTALLATESDNPAQPSTGGVPPIVVVADQQLSTQQQQQQQQAAVAMVLPQVEGQQQIQQQQQQQQQLQPSQPASQAALPQQQQLAQQPLDKTSQQQQASSSSTVTTTQAGPIKRPRDVEGDSSTDTVSQQTGSKQTPAKKRLRMAQPATGEAFQGVSGSGMEVEYQVPTSSQRDQEDEVIAVDTEEEEDEEEDDDVNDVEDDDEEEEDEDDEEEEEDVGMADEGTAEADDGPMFADGYEVGESYGGQQGAGEGPDIDEDNNIASASNNEVDVMDDDNELRNAACGSSSTSTTTTTASAAASSSGVKSSQSQPAQQAMDTTVDAETSSTSGMVAAAGSSSSIANTTTVQHGSSTYALESSSSSSSSGIGETSTTTGTVSGSNNIAPSHDSSPQQPQIQSTTSGSSSAGLAESGAPQPSGSSNIAGGSTSASTSSSSNSSTIVATARQVVNPLTRHQQQAAHLMLMQQQQSYDEGAADDRNVPSTPTLYASRRSDGFSETILSSPHPQVPNARFVFGEPSSGSGRQLPVVPVSSRSDGTTGQQQQQQPQELPQFLDDTSLGPLEESAVGSGVAGSSSSSSRGRVVPSTTTTCEAQASSAGDLENALLQDDDEEEEDQPHQPQQQQQQTPHQQEEHQQHLQQEQLPQQSEPHTQPPQQEQQQHQQQEEMDIHEHQQQQQQQEAGPSTAPNNSAVSNEAEYVQPPKRSLRSLSHANLNYDLNTRAQKRDATGREDFNRSWSDPRSHQARGMSRIPARAGPSASVHQRIYHGKNMQEQQQLQQMQQQQQQQQHQQFAGQQMGHTPRQRGGQRGGRRGRSGRRRQSGGY
ncbi:nucleoprotein TPR isoform X2 [Anopheles darlingi]|uniref:nucleoprotein TPR isoform X2 n=1 Tax=Anopheles darlingi TaxID=43151 RepID=UPI0021002F50|nr:nucleoprotein TPR isoform X2 [Anopheles darlingi]